MPKRRKSISFEKLEHRLFLSASLTDTGRLIVAGDPTNPNNITVGMSSDGSSVDVVVDNSTVQTFDASAVKNLFIVGGAGNDTLAINESQLPFTIPAKIFGGGGDDSITGGSGREYLSGDNGNDTIVTGSGDATVYGGAGSDSIAAGSGADSIYGNGGADVVDGGSGSDLMEGGGGNNVLNGGAGQDTLVGGAKSSQINTGSGDSLIISNSNSDVINVGTGSATLAGTTTGDQVVNNAGGSITDSAAPPPSIPKAPTKTPPANPPVVSTVGTVKGAVTDQNGLPIIGASVVLCTTIGDSGGFSVANSFSTTTNSSGAFILSNIPAGQYVALAGKALVGSINASINVTSGKTLQLVLALQPFSGPVSTGTGSIGGTVTDSQGNPVAGAGVQLVSQSATGAPASDGLGDVTLPMLKTTTDANGDYSLSNVTAGTYILVVVQPGAGYSQTQVTITAVQTTTANVTITTAPPPVTNGGTVAGTVTDGQGNPINKASVALTGANGQAIDATTAADGSFSITAPAGTYELAAGKSSVGLVSFANVVVVSGQTTTENLVLAAPPSTGSVSGAVVDVNGNAVAGASVILSFNGNQYTATTDSDGDYSITAPAGTFLLTASQPNDGSTDISDVVVAAGQAVTENISLPGPTPQPTTGTVSGTILDVNGNPVAGGSVALSGGGTQFTATTAGDGTYSIVAPAGTFVLTAGLSADGSNSITGVIVADGQNTTENLALPGPAPVTGTVSGTILDANGNPVAGASVVLAGGGNKYTATTAADGTFSIMAPAGTYALSSSQTNDGSTNIASVIVADDQITTEKMSLPGPMPQPIAGAVSGKIVDVNGDAVASASVVLTGNGHSYSATSASDGTFTVTAPAGTYSLTTSQTNDGSKTISSVVVADGQTTTENIALPGPAPTPTTGNVVGTITDANGNAVAGASIELTINTTHYFATSAGNGTYSAAVPGGTYSLTASATSDGSKTVGSVVVVNGQNTAENVALPDAAPTTGTVSGKINDVNGNPVAGASITLTSGGNTYAATTASNGTYSLTTPAGTYSLVAAQSNDGSSSVSSVVVIDGQTTTENVALPGPTPQPTTGAVSGKITDVNGNAVSGASITLTSGGSTYTATTIANGTYSITAPAGIYVLVANQTIDGTTTVNAVIVINGQTTTENVALPSAVPTTGIVSGKVTDVHGNAVNGASVTLSSGGTNYPATTNSSGTYTITAPGGTYTLVATQTTDGTTTINSVVVTNGQTTTENVALPSAAPTTGIVSGKITDVNGNAVNGASVTLSSGGTNYPATTNSSGTYTITAPGGTYTLVATQTTDGTTTVNSVVVTNGQTTTENVALPSAAPTTGIVSGKITDVNGNAVNGASVTLSSGGTNYPATTNSSGTYTITAPGGTYTLVATQTTDGTTTVNSVVVTNGQTTTENVALPSAAPTTGIVSGKITDVNGNAVNGASVTLSSGGTNYPATTNSSGNYTITAPGGTYTLVATQTTDGTTTINSVVVTNGQTTTENVALPSAAPTTGTVSGKITDVNGNAVNGATITLSSGGNTYTATTNSSGAYSATAPGGTYTLVATLTADGSTTVNSVSVTNGQTTTENAALPGPTQQNGTVSGTIIGLNGAGIAYASVSVFAGNTDDFTATDGNGNFSVQVPAGTYSLTATSYGIGTSTISGIVVTGGQTVTETVTIPAPPSTGVISGTVINSAGNAAPNAAVTLTSGGNTYTATTASNGTYSITAPGGTYSMSVTQSYDGTTSIPSVVIANGGTTTENISLPSAPTTGVVSGTITDVTGAEVSGASITVTSGGGTQYTATTAANGSYSVIVPGGTYSVTASQSADGSNTATGVVVTNGNTTSENMALPGPAQAKGTISGVITDGSGNPLAYVSVSVISGGTDLFVTTNSSGQYTVSGAPGVYELIANDYGVGTQTITGIVVTANQTTTVNVTL